MSDVTQILSQIEDGDGPAAERLLPLVCDELRRLAAKMMAREKPGQTVQATALVHEAYIRLVDVDKAQHWNSRGHFFNAAAEAMRRILVRERPPKAAAEMHVADRRGIGYAGVHVARAGAGARRRSAQRPVQLGQRALCHVYRAVAFPGRHDRRRPPQGLRGCAAPHT